MGRTVVIGAGVVGLACAYELLKAGREVLVVDRGLAGRGCSEGNAGWIVPAMSAPIPSPGLVATSLRWMLRSDSPLYIKPRADVAFARWLWTFWRHCRDAPYQEGLGAVMALNVSTMRWLDEWRAEGLGFEMHSEGLLFAGLRRDVVESSARRMRLLERHGYQPIKALDGGQIRELEPGLSDAVAGGFHLPDERTVRPEQLTSALAAAVKRGGGGVREQVDVRGARLSSGAAQALETSSGDIDCDAVVIAAGAWSGEVSARFGVSLPVEAGKGYSVTTLTREPVIRLPVDLIEAHVACTPFDGAVRLAGTMELSGRNLRVRPGRVEAIRKAGEMYLANWRRNETEQVWVGMRPLTPDGLPLIGKLPGLSNVWVATGHAMLGVTLAPATAHAIADALTRRGEVRGPSPFDPGRFGRR